MPILQSQLSSQIRWKVPPDALGLLGLVEEPSVGAHLVADING